MTNDLLRISRTNTRVILEGPQEQTSRDLLRNAIIEILDGECKALDKFVGDIALSVAGKARWVKAKRFRATVLSMDLRYQNPDRAGKLQPDGRTSGSLRWWARIRDDEQTVEPGEEV